MFLFQKSIRYLKGLFSGKLGQLPGASNRDTYVTKRTFFTISLSWIGNGLYFQIVAYYPFFKIYLLNLEFINYTMYMSGQPSSMYL